MKLVKSILNWVQDDWSGKLMILLFVGPMIYAIIRYLPIGAIILAIVVGYICYCWGFIRGEEKEKHENESDSNENERF